MRAEDVDTPAGAGYHFTLSAQNAGDIFPRAMLLACLALNDARLAFAAAVSPVRGGEPDTPCWPNLISLTVSPSLASTACDLVGCLGVRLGLL